MAALLLSSAPPALQRDRPRPLRRFRDLVFEFVDVAPSGDDRIGIATGLDYHLTDVVGGQTDDHPFASITSFLEKSGEYTGLKRSSDRGANLPNPRIVLFLIE
jgi:hypothetical protein